MSWDNLSMSERADYIKLGVLNGITSLDTIRATYNNYANGGSTNTEQVYYGGNLPEVTVYADDTYFDRNPNVSLGQYYEYQLALERNKAANNFNNTIATLPPDHTNLPWFLKGVGSRKDMYRLVSDSITARKSRGFYNINPIQKERDIALLKEYDKSKGNPYGYGCLYTVTDAYGKEFREKLNTEFRRRTDNGTSGFSQIEGKITDGTLRRGDIIQLSNTDEGNMDHAVMFMGYERDNSNNIIGIKTRQTHGGYHTEPNKMMESKSYYLNGNILNRPYRMFTFSGNETTRKKANQAYNSYLSRNRKKK